MPFRIRAIGALAAVVLGICVDAMAAPSAEINPFASTYDQVQARMTRIQQEVDRLRAAGMFAAADDMTRKLAHFRGELGGIEPSLILGPELDAVGMYTAYTDTPIVEVRPSDRPIVLALGAYELVHWQLNVFPGANLQKVIVSGYDGAAIPGGVPAGVPVEVYSHPTTGANYFYFYSKSETTFTDAAKTMYKLSGLTPSSMQSLSSYLGQPFAVGAGDEWKQERVLSEIQPLYKDATAFQIAQDRTAADQYRFTGLYSTYRVDGSRQSTQVAAMTPTHAIDGTIQSGLVSYKYLAVDPRGPTYYGFSSSSTPPVKFDPVSRQETNLPALTANVLGSLSGMTFDTKRNRLVLGSRAGDPPGNSFLFYYPDDGTWLKAAVSNQPDNPSALAYSAVNDAYFGLENARSAIWLARYDSTGKYTTRIDLSQFITCGFDPCQLTASGDRLVLIVPPAPDLYEPLSPPLPHSYLIDPSNGNVTILGALPEPGGLMVLGAVVALLGRRMRSTKEQKFLSTKGTKLHEGM